MAKETEQKRTGSEFLVELPNIVHNSCLSENKFIFL